MQGERVRFIVAALAYGACLPHAASLARRAGCGPGIALAAASVVLFAPSAWLTGTTPGMASIGLLGALVLLGRLWTADTDGSSSGIWMTLAVWSVCVGAQVSTLLLWPAIALASRRSLGAREDGVAGRRPVRPQVRRAVGAGGGIVLALVLGTRLAEWDPVPLPAELHLAARLFELDVDAWRRLAAVSPGVGVALYGVALLFARRASDDRRTHWLLAWCVVPVLYLLLRSTLTWDASYHWLLPVACAGFGQHVGRLGPKSAATLVTCALAAQLGLLVAFQRQVTATDPLAEWRTRTRAFIEPIDTIITGHVGHAYLASHRWGLRSVILRASDPERPSTDSVDGVYINPAGASNLRVKTQDVAAWAQEGVEARGFGFRPVLDRPFPGPSRAISEVLERELDARVDHSPIDSR